MFPQNPETPAPTVGGGAADQGGPMGIPIPNLNLSSGPAASDGTASSNGNTSGTGPFNFKGSSSAGNGTSWAQLVIPVAIGGLVLWLISRK
ncbi:hypothetical protein AT574_13965 [Phaeobacter inhibens]|nr:hypothetical protein AT574_13965 [Phaeobacter inhibens]